MAAKRATKPQHAASRTRALHCNHAATRASRTAADELIGGVIITLTRVFQSGFDDLKVPLHTREGKPAGELQLILKWQPEGGALPAQHAQQAQQQQAQAQQHQPQQQQYPPPAVAAAAGAAAAYPPPAAAAAPHAAAGYPPPATGGYPPPAVSAPAYPDTHSASVPPAASAPTAYPSNPGESKVAVSSKCNS